MYSKKGDKALKTDKGTIFGCFKVEEACFSPSLLWDYVSLTQNLNYSLYTFPPADISKQDKTRLHNNQIVHSCLNCSNYLVSRTHFLHHEILIMKISPNPFNSSSKTYVQRAQLKIYLLVLNYCVIFINIKSLHGSVEKLLKSMFIHSHMLFFYYMRTF